jgi:death-on-curing protein
MRFLRIDEVIEIHDEAIRRYGGAAGMLDIGKLEAAVSQVEAAFGGEYLYDFPWQMATAYAYGIAKAHAFLDGNKRTAAGSMGVFLMLNGYDLVVEDDELVRSVLALTTNRMSREAFTIWLEMASKR